MTAARMPIGRMLAALMNALRKKIGPFDGKTAIGLVLLLAPSFVGALTRQSASLTDHLQKRYPACDTYIRELCIPTLYLPIPIGAGWLVINLTSFLLSACLFLAGFFLVKKKS